MRKHLLVSLAILLAACAHAEPQQPLLCYLPVQSDVSYADVLALQKGSPDHVLDYGSEPLQYGELWLPPHTSGNYRHPLLMLIHGGCWLNAFDVSHTHALSSALAQSGYAVWAPEYRRVGDAGGGWPGSLDDVLAAMQFAANLEGYPLRTDEMVLVGHSAGGHLALLAGAQQRDRVKAVIGLAAIVDLPAYAQGSNSCQTAAPQFMGGSPDQKRAEYAAANPAQIELHPATTLIHGDLDAIVPLAQSELEGVERTIVKGAGHFDLIHPGAPAYQRLLQTLAGLFPQ
ncbi:MAG: alpha/beta fold hydrolase [Gammaproteobacteria bacterium]|nr:alpha/beta fold hydrolase [Gammaproteobacteria bacterium]